MNITISNNQKKKLLKAIQDEKVLFQEENGELVVDVAAYMAFKQNLNVSPIESIVDNRLLDFDSEFFIFS